MKTQLKIGIVGMGNAGMMHANSIIGGAISNAALSVVCDRKERLEIACARGKIVMEDRQSRFHRTSVPIDEFNKMKCKKGNSIILDLKDSFK